MTQELNKFMTFDEYLEENVEGKPKEDGELNESEKDDLKRKIELEYYNASEKTKRTAFSREKYKLEQARKK